MFKTYNNNNVTMTKKEAVTIQRAPFPIIRSLVEMYYDFQDQRIITGNRIDGNIRQGLIQKEDLENYGVDKILKQSVSLEKEIKKNLTGQIRQHPVYEMYLSHIYGIGVVLSSGLMAYIEDIEKFRSASSLWQYSGLGMNSFCPECKKPTYIEVEYKKGKKKKTVKRLRPMKNCQKCNCETKSIRQKRMTGYQSNYNSKMQVLCWKIGQSFLKQQEKKSGYRRLYDQIKKEEKKKHPSKIVHDGTTMYNDGHIHNMAIRKTVKIFLSHVWVKWREIEGLEVKEPYQSKVLNHSIVEPFLDR